MCNVVFISKMIHLYDFNMPMFGGYVIDRNHVYFFIKKYIRCRYQSFVTSELCYVSPVYGIIKRGLSLFVKDYG